MVVPTWLVNDVDYPSVGDTVESAKLHYALPTLFTGLPFQMLNTFVFGSLMWATRRLSRTLLLSMSLHGLWDTSIFFPGPQEAMETRSSCW